MEKQQQSPAEGDLLIGVDAIAAHLGTSRRQVENLKAKHGLPTFKMGKSVCASRTALSAHIRSMCNAAIAEMDKLQGAES